MFCIFIHFEEGYAPRNPPRQSMGHIPQDSEGPPIVLLQFHDQQYLHHSLCIHCASTVPPMYTVLSSHVSVRKTAQSRAVSCTFLARFYVFWRPLVPFSTEKARSSYTFCCILHPILHLILHRKMSTITGCLRHWCRKCRIFHQNFFWGGGEKNHETAYNTTWKPENIGLLCLKHPYFRGKTSVLLSKEVRCFLISGGFHKSASSDFRILCPIYCSGKSRHPQGLIHIGRPCSL